MFAKRIAKKLLGALVVSAGLLLLGNTADAKAPVIGSEKIATIKMGEALPPIDNDTSIVYFTRHIDAAHLIKLYNLINDDVIGRTAIKVHTGEKNGPNILPREMVRDLQAEIPRSTIVETNAIFGWHGDRNTTADHRETLKVNGWTFSPVDIMDEDGEVSFPVKNGLRLKEVSMGSHILNYDSMLVLTHFKGHGMGGFGGSLKNIGIGNAGYKLGKRQVHGVVNVLPSRTSEWPLKDELMENIADSGKATLDHFGSHITYINVLRRLSVDCDCVGLRAAEPVLPDIGILASKDILAIDQASYDLVFDYPTDEKNDLVERINSRHGLRQLSAMKELGMGKGKYILVSIDND